MTKGKHIAERGEEGPWMIALSPLPLCKGKPSLFCNRKTSNVLKCRYYVKLGPFPPPPPPHPNQLMILGVHDKWDAYETW